MKRLSKEVLPGGIVVFHLIDVLPKSHMMSQEELRQAKQNRERCVPSYPDGMELTDESKRMRRRKHASIT